MCDASYDISVCLYSLTHVRMDWRVFDFHRCSECAIAQNVLDTSHITYLHSAKIKSTHFIIPIIFFIIVLTQT